jgi:hypothetical protein
MNNQPTPQSKLNDDNANHECTKQKRENTDHKNDVKQLQPCAAVSIKVIENLFAVRSDHYIRIAHALEHLEHDLLIDLVIYITRTILSQCVILIIA